MNTMPRKFVAGFLCLLLSACDLSVPKLASGDVSIYEGGHPARSWQMSAVQVASLHAWFEERRTGWTPDVATYAPTTLVTVTDVGGSKWGIYVHESTVVIAGAAIQRKQSFPATDITSLLTAIGAKHDG